MPVGPTSPPSAPLLISAVATVWKVPCEFRLALQTRIRPQAHAVLTSPLFLARDPILNIPASRVQKCGSYTPEGNPQSAEENRGLWVMAPVLRFGKFERNSVYFRESSVKSSPHKKALLPVEVTLETQLHILLPCLSPHLLIPASK